MDLRVHQRALQQVLQGMDSTDIPADILVDVVPGGGKSVLPALLCNRFPDVRVAWFVPRLSLARQAAIGMSKDFGIEIRESGNDVNPSRGSRGFVATHAALTADPALWRDELSRRPYLLVIDELHHAKLTRSGEDNALAKAIARLPFHVRLCMTGTLETNDNTLIFNVPYCSVARGYEIDLEAFDGQVIRYGRLDALREGAIVPIEFHHHDGDVKWEDSTGVQEHRLSKVDPADEAQAVWTALRTDLADQLLGNCISHWKQFGDRLLVVTADQATAKAYHSTIQRQGISCGLAVSDADDAHGDIELFREGGFRCLVTCQMAYEGLDVPAITHIACLTHIRSSPWILQMLARAWRSLPGKNKCWAFVPNDPRMNRVIDKIRQEQQVIVGLPRDSTGSGGAKGHSAFVPISGELSGVIAEMLDSAPEDSEIAIQVAQLCRQANLPLDHPSAAQFISALRTGGVRLGRITTISEQEDKVRIEITKACNRADFDKGCEPGTHQKRLYKALNYRSIKVLTLKELECARSVCTRVCS
jgi:superfamily II DNA or RNA helicase